MCQIVFRISSGSLQFLRLLTLCWVFFFFFGRNVMKGFLRCFIFLQLLDQICNIGFVPIIYIIITVCPNEKDFQIFTIIVCRLYFQIMSYRVYSVTHLFYYVLCLTQSIVVFAKVWIVFNKLRVSEHNYAILFYETC